MTDREQIEAIAKIVGWKWTSQEMWRSGKEHFLLKQMGEQSKTFLDHLPNWLGSLDACKELIEAMRKDGFCFFLTIAPSGPLWSCQFWNKETCISFHRTGETPERAICRAFLTHHGKWKD